MPNQRVSSETKLYKYLSRKNADSMLTDGSLRVGTLSDFRRNPDPEVGDPGEGTLTIHTTPPPVVYRQDSELPRPMRHVIGGLTGNNVNLSFSGMSFMTEHRVPDAYIYCMTDEPNRKSLKKFEYDACIEIINSTMLCGIITNELLKIIRQPVRYRLGKCVYEGRESKDDILDEIYTRKEARHFHQKEWRYILDVGEVPSPLEPIIIANKLITQLIREIRL